jgi:hypothetical protein
LNFRFKDFKTRNDFFAVINFKNIKAEKKAFNIHFMLLKTDKTQNKPVSGDFLA